MEWPDIITKILLPVSTFVLGIAAAFAMKRADLRRTGNREHVQAIVKLANQWYNQIHELVVAHQYKPGDEDTKRATSFYVSNRLVLPEFLLHLEALRQTGKYSKLVEQIDAFLAVVTKTPNMTNDVSRNYQCHYCAAPFRVTEDNRQSEAELIEKLDQRLQQIVQLAGRELQN